MKIAFLCDTHWGARGDHKELRQSMADFHDDIFFPEIEDRGVEYIIHLGDLVDRRKYINFQTLSMMNHHFINRIKIPMDIIAGNHDTYYKNHSHVNALNTLLDDKNYQIVKYINPAETEIDGIKFLYLPWINELNADQTADLMANSDASIVMGHLEIAGFQMIRGMLCPHGLDFKSFRRFAKVYTGHFHIKSSRDNITYLGSPYAMNWSEAEDPHGFHIFDTKTLELEYIENPHSMFVKLFYDKDTSHTDIPDVSKKWVKLIVKEKPDAYVFDNYVKALHDQDPYEMRVVEPITQVSEDIVVSEADDTNVIIDKTIEARLDLDKDQREELKRIMAGLYREASDLIVER